MAASLRALRAPTGIRPRAAPAPVPARAVAMRLSKTELKDALADSMQITRKEASEAVDTILDIIMSNVEAGEDVTLTGFGTFKKRLRAARTGRNPQTGAALQIPAKSAPAFTAGKLFKARVSGEAAAAAKDGAAADKKK